MSENNGEDDVLINVRDAVLHYPLTPLSQGSIKTSFLSGFRKQDANQPEFYEALSGVSLTVRKGDRLGIIGRNGAGKSTILRAIAGIYPLHSGSIVLNGEIRSIFDLGVGFEMEETGRSNIYYRGYLLGYPYEKIREIEEEIISFAGLHEFIDRPLKTYSAGMQIRLAFAVSTAMGGDILLVDEVLAAGDADFSEKAYKRMMELIEQAACLIFVSHDLQAIEKICNEVMWIEQGKVRITGQSTEVIREYLGAAVASEHSEGVNLTG